VHSDSFSPFSHSDKKKGSISMSLYDRVSITLELAKTYAKINQNVRDLSLEHSLTFFFAEQNQRTRH
jgi:hypothetical protein